MYNIENHLMIELDLARRNVRKNSYIFIIFRELQLRLRNCHMHYQYLVSVYVLKCVVVCIIFSE